MWPVCRVDNLIVLKSGSLNLLEPSGPVQACNGIAFTYRNYSIVINLDFYIYHVIVLALFLCEPFVFGYSTDHLCLSRPPAMHWHLLIFHDI